MMKGCALGKPADGGRIVAVKLTWPLGFTVTLVVLNVTTGLACTTVCSAQATAIIGHTHGSEAFVANELKCAPCQAFSTI